MTWNIPLTERIVPHNFSFIRPRMPRMESACFDPFRRLLAAVALQAVIDVLYPRNSLSHDDRMDAWEFLISDDGQCILAQFVGPKLAKLMMEISPQERRVKTKKPNTDRGPNKAKLDRMAKFLDLITAHPGASNQKLSKMLGVSYQTILNYRAELTKNEAIK